MDDTNKFNSLFEDRNEYDYIFFIQRMKIRLLQSWEWRPVSRRKKYLWSTWRCTPRMTMMPTTISPMRNLPPPNSVPNPKRLESARSPKRKRLRIGSWRSRIRRARDENLSSCSHCQELGQQASWLLIGCTRVNNQSEARLASWPNS